MSVVGKTLFHSSALTPLVATPASVPRVCGDLLQGNRYECVVESQD